MKNEKKSILYLSCIIILLLLIFSTILLVAVDVWNKKKMEKQVVSYICTKEAISNGVESFEEKYLFDYSLNDKKVIYGERTIIVYFKDKENFETADLFSSFPLENIPRVITKDITSLTHTLSWEDKYRYDTESQIDNYIKDIESLGYSCHGK